LFDNVSLLDSALTNVKNTTFDFNNVLVLKILILTLTKIIKEVL